jgi:hypothetical protein
MKPTWLEGVDLPGVPERHAEHKRLAVLVAEADAARKDLRLKHAREDETREAKLRAGILSGRKVTLPELNDRLGEVAAAEERYQAALGALDDFVTETLAEAEERTEEWLAILAEKKADAERRREEAQRLLDEADLDVRRLVPLRNWIERTVGIGRAPDHIALSALGVPSPPKTLDLANVGTGVISHV